MTDNMMATTNVIVALGAFTITLSILYVGIALYKIIDELRRLNSSRTGKP